MLLTLCILLTISAGLLFRQVKLTRKATRNGDAWRRLYEQAHHDRAVSLEKCRELARRHKALLSRLDTAERAPPVPVRSAKPERGASGVAAQRPKKQGVPETPPTLTLPIQLLSKNVRDRLHWRQQRQLKADYLDIIRIKYRQPVTPQVRQKATVIRVKGASERDFDQQNIGAGSAIELIDALTAAGYWRDDSPRWLETAFRQCASGKIKGPAVVVEIVALE